ncbi:MAG: YceI family protein [Desulfuromonadales bacterium]|nr:YceI family protein [Desulfuromonadales bacterium]
MNIIITCAELTGRMAAGAVVVDVMTPENYALCHVAGAKNACIYEMVFLDRIAEAVPGRDTELVVYDATGTSRAAQVARERLIEAGYTTVAILSGGLAGWCGAGLPVEGDKPLSSGQVLLRDGVYRIDTDASTLEWTGRNLNNRHHGRIAIQGGELGVHDGRLSRGNIVLDMTTITNLDLQDPEWRSLLHRHLMSEDFFAVQRFPTASFMLTGWQKQEGAPAEAPGGIATGDLTIRGVTRSIGVPAIVAPQADGSIKAHAAFCIDRTQWQVNYGSARLFERLGMHLVHELISLELFVLAR